MAKKTKVKRDQIGTPEHPSNQIFTISNFITLLRFVLTLVFLYLFVKDYNRVVSIVIYIVAASTDWLDGTIARKTKTVSWLGKVMDPMVDRALLFTGVLGLVAREELPVWICAVIIGRDVYLAFGNAIVQQFHKRPIDVVYTGKIATAFLMTGFSFMLLGLPVLPGLNILHINGLPTPGLDATAAPFGIFLVYIGVVFSLFTAAVYTVKGFVLSKHAIDYPEQEDTDFLNPEIED